MVREDFSTIIRKIRIISGAILFAYVIMHLLNHSINIFSIDLADAVRSSYFHPVWQNPVGLVLLYGSFVAHMILGFSSILTRKSFKMKAKDWIQIIFPVLALLFLLQHIAISFIITKIFGGEETYSVFFAAMNTETPSDLIVGAILFSLMTIFIWVHGAIGIDSYLKQQAVHHNKFTFYIRYPSLFRFVYWIVPVGAVLGWLSGLRNMSFIAQIQSFEMDMPIPNYLGSIIFKYIPQEAFPIIMQVEPLVMKYYPLVVLFIILVCILNVTS